MKTQQYKRSEVRKIAGLMVASIFLFQEATPVLYAQELRQPVNPAPQTAAPLASKTIRENPKAVNQTPSETRPYSRNEKAAKWLEKHPKAKERMDKNQDGKVDKKEFKRAQHQRQLRRQQAHRKDYDNNPPGMAGGPGTNWENRPGQQGGPGTSPDRPFRNFQKDRDNNPPGLRGGRGTNWENRPGPSGGPGAGPDRGEYRRDRDNNPPGPRGGRGTNWENRPGPRGGAGASPNRGAGGGGFGGGRGGGGRGR